MEDYISMKIKNHKEYNKKILFVMLKKPTIEYNKQLMIDIVNQYKTFIIEHENLSVVFDTRQLNNLNPRLAWEGATLVSKLNDIAIKNVICSCLIMENGIVKSLFKTIIKVHPLVVPFRIVNDNKNAIEFITENMKKI